MKTRRPKAETPPTAPAPVFFREAKVAADLGLDRERLKKIRVEHLTAPGDFMLVDGEISLTEAGLKKVEALTSAGPVKENGQKFQPGPAQVRKFSVVKVLPNKRLLFCVPAADRENGRKVLVRVKDNTLFMPRMELDAIEAEQGSWQFRGRLPRRKGRW